MTREDAISVLERVAHTESTWPGTEDTLKALDMAISALRQQDVADKDVGKNEPLTNAQKIRSMNDEELAKLLCCTGWRMIEQKECLEWLKQPAKDGGNDDGHDAGLRICG